MVGVLLRGAWGDPVWECDEIGCAGRAGRAVEMPLLSGVAWVSTYKTGAVGSNRGGGKRDWISCFLLLLAIGVVFRLVSPAFLKRLIG